MSQGESSIHVLEELREFFGCGRVYANRRDDNHRENMAQFIVGRRDDLVERIIPFFRQYPLRTAKRNDFETFAMCVDLMSGGRHLTPSGLMEIERLATKGNRRKTRTDRMRILRSYTPEALETGS